MLQRFKRFCGIGAIYNKDGISMDHCRQLLSQLQHRGAYLDGCGVLLEIPWHLYPSLSKHRAVAQCFIKDASQIDKIYSHLKNNYQVELRHVPTTQIIKNTPSIVQFIVTSNKKFDPIQTRLDLESKFDIYVASCHSKTIVYKALCRPHELFDFYTDLPLIKTRFAICHVRFSTNTEPSWDYCQPLRNIAHNGEFNTVQSNINFLKSANCKIPENPSDSTVFDLALDHYSSIPFADRLPLLMGNNNHSPPFEGPAAIIATDGKQICSIVDKCGLRPNRIMSNGSTVVLASEFMLFDNLSFTHYDQLKPNHLLSLNLNSGKFTITNQNKHRSAFVLPPSIPDSFSNDLLSKFNYSSEEMGCIISPMQSGNEPMSSMGADTPLPLFNKNNLLFDFCHHSFAQVSNPSIDPIRESSFTVLECPLYYNDERIIPTPIMDIATFTTLVDQWNSFNPLPILTIDAFMPSSTYDIQEFLKKLSLNIPDIPHIMFISDTSISSMDTPIPILYIVDHLKSQFKNAVIVVQSLEARQVHHMSTLITMGADIIIPRIHSTKGIQACTSGLVKVMAKMGITSVQGYKNGHFITTLGLDHFNTTSFHPILTIKDIEDIYLKFNFHQGSSINARLNGQVHLNEASQMIQLQKSIKMESYEEYLTYSNSVHKQHIKSTLRGQDLAQLPITTSTDRVEDSKLPLLLSSFSTGAMSFGSISQPAHSTLREAMHAINGYSNTGEGGSPHSQSLPSEGIQLASGRFGVDYNYIKQAKRVQIKIAQGAKPGQGGELDKSKITVDIAATRKTLVNISLISPPNQHDIYSIEDLQQLIMDVRSINPNCCLSVKLVASPLIGVISIGVVKAGADHICISGYDGGTGAASLTAIKQCGLPVEIGIDLVQDALTKSNLRDHVLLQVDGGLKTAYDVVHFYNKGADEFGFSTMPLIAMGCIMMRQCHLNTCPVGIATTDPVLVNHYKGSSKDVITTFHYLAQHCLQIFKDMGIEYKKRSVTPLKRQPFVPLTDNITNMNLSITTTKELELKGISGQSLGCWLTGKIKLQGLGNDYCGKGMSGGTLIIDPTGFINSIENQMVAGNVCLYGATSGLFVAKGRVGERFAIRNSGCNALVYGMGQYGCEYMTGGIVCCLGPYGDGLGSGMTGGSVYVLKDHYRPNEYLEESPIDQSDLKVFQPYLPKECKFVKLVPKGSVDKKKAYSNKPWQFPVLRDPYKDPIKRIEDFEELTSRLSKTEIKEQAGRCLECGTPTCQSNVGCPIGNKIPDWHHEIKQGKHFDAFQLLMQTNPFPEFTGRACPAPCQDACVVKLVNEPISIKSIEAWLIDEGYKNHWIHPVQPKRVGKSIGIIGSGPAGLTAAYLLNKRGFTAIVYDDNFGGLLTRGIPDMKLNNDIVHRRLDLMRLEGISFVKRRVNDLKSISHDAIVICTGALQPRSLDVNGENVFDAMDFLTTPSDLTNKKVIIVGAGDTATDCLGTSLRRHCKDIVILDRNMPSKETWPLPKKYKVDYGHEEFIALYNMDPRRHGTILKHVMMEDNKVTHVVTNSGVVECDLLISAIGFQGTELDLIQSNKITTRNNLVHTSNYKTNIRNVYAAGDCRMGQSLIVWGIREGKQVSRQIERDLLHTQEISLVGQ